VRPSPWCWRRTRSRPSRGRSPCAAAVPLHATPPAEIAATVGPRFFEGLDPPLLAAGIARYRALGIWMTAPRFPQAAFDRLQAAMLGAGAIARAPGFAACVDTAIEAEALSAA
jgi:hypothetical protein